MLSRLVFLAAALGLLVATAPARAASFDCAKASTPFEHAICDNPELSTADERLARTYQTAIGGLSESVASAMRTGQRTWLDYARRACTRDAEPLTSGSYDERGVSCLVSLFTSRARVLEQSRMIEGLRFYPFSRYAALPDPNATEPDSSFPVAQHELSKIRIDGDDDTATKFNALVDDAAVKMANIFGAQGGEDDIQDNETSDSTNSIFVKEVVGTGRITLEASTYWYGHGAAHGNWTRDYLHYLRGPGRWMEASDMFTGKGWEKALLRLTIAALKAEHGDNLMLDDTKYIAEPVTDPARWDLSDPYGLVIQFQPYEVSAYAYGAPTARVSWEDLADYLAEGADAIRYGF
ncbi:DUF3298 domain-containing protein [Devosia sp. FJ2-5-3]|uniref:DUF3298 domain-containing protein n=1 Tax=Devosia sp. FJ2-5-3 TaxID=2976680 RepID=UPI0023D87FA6|nr:DUF3298 domain-containing protein [Devosia sp. FJ2-5-3]WEJ58135.1 lysozyme inhibitor LprI family protein [Devosia sp. FJ2-5-3]